MRVAVEIALSDDEVAHLSKLSKSRSASVRLAERSRIILLAGAGMTNAEIGDELGITRQKASRWRKRYALESKLDGGEGGHQYVIGGPDMEMPRFETAPDKYIQGIER